MCQKNVSDDNEYRNMLDVQRCTIWFITQKLTGSKCMVQLQIHKNLKEKGIKQKLFLNAEKQTKMEIFHPYKETND